MTRDIRNLDGPFVSDGERSASQAEIAGTPPIQASRGQDGGRSQVEALRTTVQDYALAHDTLLTEIRRFRQENRSLRGQLDAARTKIVQLYMYMPSVMRNSQQVPVGQAEGPGLRCPRTPGV